MIGCEKDAKQVGGPTQHRHESQDSGVGASFDSLAGGRRIRFAREGLNTPQEQNRER